MPLERALRFGDALFETVRLYGGRPFRLDRHLTRLSEGSRRVGIPLPADLEERIEEVLAAWGPRDGALRILLGRTGGEGLLPSAQTGSATRIWAAALAPAGGDGADGAGLRAVLRGFLHEGALTAGLKCTGYLERVQALREAAEAGAGEALLRNSQGRVVEGSASNLFWVVEGELRTPPEEDGALAGVTREAVLGLTRELGIPVRLASPTPAELHACDEAFLSSSLRELAPVVEIEGRAVGAGRPGPLFLRLRRAFRVLVARETGG